MVALFKNSFGMVRAAPLFSAFDIPWQALEYFKLSEKCVIFPRYNSDIDAIQHTVARLFCSCLIPHLTWPAAKFNLGLGGFHVVWCLYHIQMFQDKKEGYERQELETAFIRLLTAVYDLALMLLLFRSFPCSRIARGAFYVVIAVFPDLTLQIHQSLFNKAVVKESIDHFHLQEGCVIKQFAKGLTDMILPASEEQSVISRLCALPSAMGKCASPQKKRP